MEPQLVLSRRQHRIIRLITITVASVAIGVTLLATPKLSAQIVAASGDQAPAVPSGDHPLIGTGTEQVNPANGQVEVHIPVPVPGGRGPQLHFALDYDSGSAAHLIWDAGLPTPALSWRDNSSVIGGDGWSYALPELTYNYHTLKYTGPTGQVYTCYVLTDFVLQNVDGDQQLGISPVQEANGKLCPTVPTGTPGPPIPTAYLTGYNDVVQAASQACSSGDCQLSGGGVIAPPLSVADASGTVYSFSSVAPGSGTWDETMLPTIEDRNGNELSISSSGAGALSVWDEEKRVALATSGFGASGNTITVSGLSTPYTIDWGSWSQSGYGVSAQYDPSNPSGCQQVPTDTTTVTGISSVELPNGQSYQFQYAKGLLSKIIFPSGGYVRYVWGTGPVWSSVAYPETQGGTGICVARYNEPVVTARYVSFNGSTEVLEQDFSYAAPTWSSSYYGDWQTRQTTVTTKDLVTGATRATTYNYEGFSLGAQPNDPTTTGSGEVATETSIVHADGSGNVLETDDLSGPFDLPPSRTVTLDNGETRETERDYGSSPCGRLVLDAERDYDYGSGSPGAILRQTVYTYASFADTPIFPSAPSICDLPSSVVTEDGSGNRVAETDYAYDQTTPAATSGVSGKDYSSGNTGNLTTESRWVSTTNSDLNTTFTYDDTGRLLTVTNPLDAAQGKTTETISYADDFAGGNPATPTDAYPTTITDALGHTREYSWNYATGELASSTGENGHTTTYTYSDPLARLTQVDYPDGGETTYTYNDTAPSPSVTTSKEISSGNWLTTVKIMDGMGHVVETETTSDPAGTDYVATTYDGLGQVLTVTNPYRSTSDPTYGVTSYTYDGLGRTTSVTHPDGSVVNTTYTGRATAVVDEGNGSYNVTRISQVDGLGRLVAVCEVDATGMPVGGGATPVPCNLDVTTINGSTPNGFLTAYGYDTLGNLTSVAQSGLNSRTFAYDSLSRLLSADNPESGTISYTYDTAACGAVAAPGELTCSTAPEPNQTNPKVTTSTAYTYDADSRVLTKTYSDGTPEDEFDYGQPNPWGPALSNPVGHLTFAGTLSGGSVNTGETFSYDSMGRVITSQQCVPASWSCGTNANTLNYTYNLLGNTTSAGNGAGVTLSYAYNNAAELTSITSSLSDSNHPGTLFSAPSYDAGGQLTGLTYGNNQTETDAYSDRMQLTSRSITGASSPATGSLTISGTEQSKNGTPATAGTGSVTIGGSEQSIAATSGAASVTITGSEQSGSTTATHATGSVSIGGSEQSYNYCYNAGPGGTQCQEMYQGGGVFVTVNGATEQGDYLEGSTDDSVASALASAFNANDSGEISATASNGTVYFTTVATGAAANYSMSTSAQYSTQYWSSPSFTGYLSGATLTGGSNASTYYDSGTVSIAVNGQNFTVSYGQNSTTASIASALASAINAGSSYASASVSGSAINLTAKTTGSGTNYALSTSSATGDSSQFSSPSFGASPSGSAFTGGQNTIYDSGTVTITVNGFAESASYGNGSTSSSLASALASGFAGASGSPVSATAAGGTVDLTSKTTGSSTNYSLSASSATGDSGQFSSPSFSTSPSGSSLTGGTAGTATTYDSGTVWARVGSFKATVNYGQSDTDSSIATNLASALSASGSPVTATASGSTVSITTNATGAGADTSFTAGSSTNDSTDFGSASFAAGPTSGSLTGGGVGSYSVTGIGYAPDGDVTGDTDSVNGQWQYVYGPLNRLLEACDPNCTSPSTAVGYVYDRFGNRWEQNSLAGGVPAPQLTFDVNNHIVGASYDAAGDLLADAAGHSYTYNAQHRIATADNNAIQYVYNAFGQRVEKSVGGVAKYYLYDPAGQAVTVLDQNGNWLRGEIFAGGRHIATYVNNTTDFDYSDWLGTERLTATISGTEQDACTSLPYGDDFACSGPGSDPSPLHFTGQQHDNETGLDHFPARYYTSTWGVWMTPDWSRSPTGVPYATFSDPQSLDLYNYALGNPDTNTDPNGHWCFLGIGTTCPPSRTDRTHAHDTRPGAFGPRWFQECEADLQCGSMNVWPFLESGVGQAQFDLKHPLIGSVVLLASLLAPEAEDAAPVAEDAVAAETDASAFSSQKALEDHFLKHGSDFGAGTPAQYEAEARDFLAGPKTGDTLEKVRPNGDIVRYDSATNQFGVISKDGVIRTYFKPKTGIAYFNAQ